MRSSAATGHERDTQLIKLFEETQQRAPSLTPRELAQLLEVSGKLSGPKSSMAVRTAARHAAAALVDTLRTWSPEARMDLVNTNTDSINNFARNLIEGLRWTEALTAEQAGQLAEEVLVQIAPTLRNEQLAECLEQLGHMTCQGTLVNTAEFIALLHQRIPHMTLSALAQMCLYVYGRCCGGMVFCGGALLCGGVVCCVCVYLYTKRTRNHSHTTPSSIYTLFPPTYTPPPSHTTQCCITLHHWC